MSLYGYADPALRGQAEAPSTSRTYATRETWPNPFARVPECVPNCLMGDDHASSTSSLSQSVLIRMAYKHLYKTISNTSPVIRVLKYQAVWWGVCVCVCAGQGSCGHPGNMKRGERPRTREFGAEEVQKGVFEGRGGSALQDSVACSAPGPRNDGRIAGACAQGRVGKGGNPSRTFTVVSLCLSGGRLEPSPSIPPHTLFVRNPSGRVAQNRIKEKPPGSYVL